MDRLRLHMVTMQLCKFKDINDIIFIYYEVNFAKIDHDFITEIIGFNNIT